MKWYYVENGQQAGPVEEVQLAELVQTGRLRGDTLVWHEGMAAWQPFSTVKPAEISIPGAPLTGVAGTTGESTEAVCTECGKIFRKDEMIRHKDVYVCAGCKPVFMQKLGEGVATGVARGRRSLPVDADALIAEVEGRGYDVDIGSCLSRGWAVFKANFGVCVGATFLVMLCNQAAGFIPIVGIILSLMVQGPLMGGLNNFFIKLIRGESSGINDAFSGFSKSFWRLCGSFLLMCLLIYVWIIPVVVYAIVMDGSSAQFGPVFWILAVIGFVGAMYVGVALVFALALCADLELGPWDSLRVSNRIVSKRWFSVFGLVVVAGLLSALGIFGCIIGIIFTLPLFYAVTMQAYEDIFGARS
ncbi:MAG TPA: DUF4339 domain-containing protein [Verrucomicrobiae bacterium]|nr:DUF4339 domain-containing protein [Verrucomicrobiae bacterium]